MLMLMDKKEDESHSDIIIDMYDTHRAKQICTLTDILISAGNNIFRKCNNEVCHTCVVHLTTYIHYVIIRIVQTLL